MAEYMVVCGKCGKHFDANAEGYYNGKTRQFICLSCAGKLMDTGSRPSIIFRAAVDMLLKLYLGIVFLLPDPKLPAENFEDTLVSVIIGLILIGWAVLAFAKALQAKTAAPNIAEMLFKVIFGSVFVSMSLDAVFVDALIFIILGCAMAAWGILPFVIARKKEKEIGNLINAAAVAEAHTVRICPHCGATSRGDHCEYCGSAF